MTGLALGLVVAAGRARRMGCEGNKLFLPVQGRSLLVHTLMALAECEILDALCLVCREEEISRMERDVVAVCATQKIQAVIAGGVQRKDSVRKGLLWAMEQQRWDVVAIHDGARPLISKETVARCVQSAMEHGSGVAAVPVIDTIKAANPEGWVLHTLDRSTLWNIQTPQAFSLSRILDCYERGEEEGVSLSDDAQLMERLGLPVKLVMGAYDNIKVTTPEDLSLVETLLGQGREEGKGL